jgi:hypothetical protein
MMTTTIVHTHSVVVALSSLLPSEPKRVAQGFASDVKRKSKMGDVISPYRVCLVVLALTLLLQRFAGWLRELKLKFTQYLVTILAIVLVYTDSHNTMSKLSSGSLQTSVPV